jgi:PAS domain S-box-containing protein
MNDFHLTCLRDPRLSAHALSAHPAWLWSVDAAHVLWANGAGAAIFAASPSALVRAQVGRLATTLPEANGPQIETLRGFDTGDDSMLRCACSRISVAGTPGILIVALEPAGPELTREERARALIAGSATPVAILSIEGTLLHAEPAEHFAQSGELATLGTVRAERIGDDRDAALLATFEPSKPSPPPPPVIPPPQAGEASERSEPAGGRRPLRFVWQMDADGLFKIAPGEFAALTDQKFAGGVTWNEIAPLVDPESQVARAVSRCETWTGLVVRFPLVGRSDGVPVELSGVPMFGADRAFAGYRGFGICRMVPTSSSARADDPVAPAPPSVLDADDQLPARHEPPVLTIVPREKNVLPFRAAQTERSPALSAVERKAFGDLARRLSARLNGDDTAGPADAPAEAAETDEPARLILDRLPVGVLVYRFDHLLYANRALLDWAGYADLHAMAEAGGLESLLIEQHGDGDGDGTTALMVTPADNERPPLPAKLFGAPWAGDDAHVLMLAGVAGTAAAVAAEAGERGKQASLALRTVEAESRELAVILDTATDGVVVIDGAGKIISANRSAAALFGTDEITGRAFVDLFAPESRRAALYYLDGLANSGVASVLNDGREVIGRERSGGLIPLFMTVGRIADDPAKFCAVFRDITSWKQAEEELTNAKRQAEQASSAKSDFLAKISHEMRTPLNAIIGFSEVMMEERFGPMGNERYREYLKDIRESGAHVVSLINDLLDLSKIEAGKLELDYTSVNLNDVTQQCVALMQPQANRARIIIRSALAEKLPQIVADARSVRQIALNLLSNSIKFTGAGGQVIVSTALTDAGEVTLRVRDTGIGMSEKDIATALEPFRQLATSGRGGSGTGLGLPLTKALAEANRASFAITSAANVGTLVEITFPPTRVLAE